MDIARYSIQTPVNTWLTVIVFFIGGIIAFNELGRLEDPAFTIKTAKVFTHYPGASSYEVEEEVTDRLEQAVQQMSQLDKVTSKSSPGVSELTIDILKTYSSKDLPQIWDELRRKINDAQKELPPGVVPSVVVDDFGDVFGTLYALTGEGYTPRDLKNFAKTLRTELLLVPGVAKISLDGVLEEQIFVEISLSQFSKSGVSPQQIYSVLKTQNVVSPSGQVRVGPEFIRISPTGEFASVKEIGDLLIPSGTSNSLVRLSDIAVIKRGYKEVPSKLIRHNGKPALTVGISAGPGVNVVDLGQRIDKKLAALKAVTPIGMELKPIYDQPKIVDQSVRGFVISLAEAIAIVIVVLLLFMGLRAGLIIGAILLLTVLGTFIFMKIFAIDLQRISLGALVIALGMLVDNAIVVTEGILIKVQQGRNRIEAASEVVKQTNFPLLGATIVGIIAFAPIGLSSDSTGEYCQSLFLVILISLLLSWLLAITVTPLFCNAFLKSGEAQSDPYNNIVFRSYRQILIGLIRVRWLTLGAMVGLLAVAIFGFRFVGQSFFPDSNTPLLLVNYWKAQGTDIRATDADMKTIEKHFRTMDGVTDVTSYVGSGADRFTLTYTPEAPNSSYGFFIIRVDDHLKINALNENVRAWLSQNFPDSEPKTQRIRLGPGRDAKIEARFSGPDAAVLRQISLKAQEIMRAEGAVDIKDDWRQREKIVRPIFNENLARNAGITRKDINGALQMSFSGLNVGIYRENDELIKILVRPPDEDRLDIGSISNVPVWSPIKRSAVPINQIVSGFETRSEDTAVRRYNKLRTIIASSDPKDEGATVLFKRLRPKIEAMDLPPGYSIEWGGEYEDSQNAQKALFGILPIGFLAMVLVVILLFGKVRQPLIIWLTVPLAIIGVTAGLLAFNGLFGFMSLLGLLSLSGMLIKNAIVLIDQIDFEIDEGKQPFNAIVDSSVSRVRPVSMAAFTTVLGMIPLLADAFFVDMAITIMAGLTFATILTLLIVPVLYAVFFKVPVDMTA